MPVLKVPASGSTIPVPSHVPPKGLKNPSETSPSFTQKSSWPETFKTGRGSMLTTTVSEE